LILDHLNWIDTKLHSYKNYFSRSVKESLFEEVFHETIFSDLYSIFTLYISGHLPQACIILRHLIETFVISLIADIVTNFSGTFSSLLSKPWKKDRKKYLISWKNRDKKNRDLEFRLERIKVLNRLERKHNFHEYYFNSASEGDIEILFSLPACEKCFEDEKEISFYKNTINKAMRVKRIENPKAKFLSDFYFQCTFCGKLTNCNTFAIAFPDMYDLVTLFKRIYPKLNQDFEDLEKIYGYLSQEFVHFSMTINHFRNSPIFLSGVRGNSMNIWGIDGLLNVFTLLIPLIEFYFERLEIVRK